jgi:rubrerythrin
MNDQSSNWSEALPRMLALAERFADEGQMNLNKLLEAAVYAQTRRAAWRYRPEVTIETVQTELHASIQGLKRDQAATELIATLERGYLALSEEQQADLLFSEAPDVFVCRTCGYLSMNNPPDRCPDCGSWPGRFRKFVGFFNGDNSEPINPIDVIRLLGRNAKDLELLVEGLSEEQLIRIPGKNEWSMRDHVAHFYDAQEMLDARLELMLEQDDPEIAALAIYDYATEGERHPSPTSVMLAKFLDDRASTVARLEALPLKDLWRTGHHSEFGQMTILRQVAYLAYHEQTHLPEIEELRQRFTTDD